MKICIIRKMCMIVAMLLCIAMIGMSTWGTEAEPDGSLRLLLYKGSVELLNEEGESVSKLVKEESDSVSDEAEKSEPISEDIALNNGDSLLTGKDSLVSVELEELRLLTLDSETSIGYLTETDDDSQDSQLDTESQENPSEDAGEDPLILELKDGSILLDIQEDADQDQPDQKETDPFKPVEIRTSNATVTIPPIESEDEGGESRGSQSENARNNESADDAEGDSRSNETADDAEGESRNTQSEDTGGDSQGRRSQDTVEETPGTFISMTQLKSGDERLKDLSEETQKRIKDLLEEKEDSSGDSREAAAPADTDTDWNVTILVVLRGSAGITWTDENEEEQILSVPAGREVILIGNEDGLLADPVTTIIKEEELSSFITDNLSEEQKEELEALLDKVNSEESESRSNDGSSRSGNRSGSNNSGNSNGSSSGSGGNNRGSGNGSSSGDSSGGNRNSDRNRDKEEDQKETEITTEVYFIAASGSKTYDGTALTAAEVTASGLPEGYFYAATATGSQTDAGFSANVVNAYTIYDAEGTDKTALFTNVKTTDGTLTVTPAAVTITTGSDSKVYDGTPLTAAAGIDGLASGESVTITASSITDVGITINNYSISWDNAKESNYSVTESLGTLQVNPATATITTDSAAKEFDGSPLTCAEAGITGLISGETATVTATGTITDVGTTENTYSIDWGTTNKDNYTVTESLGTLEITVNTNLITLTAGSGSKTYDGTPLTAEVTVSGLPEGFTYAATAGSQTDAGSTTSVVNDGYQFFDATGDEKTVYFSNITKVDGILTVTPAAVTITTESATKEFNGTPLTAAAGIEGLAPGESVTLSATGTITDIGTTMNTYSIDWGTTNKDNYTVTENLGTLEITANTSLITLTAASGTKPYDGTALTAEVVTATGLPEGFTFVASATGSQTEVGVGDNVVNDGYVFYDMVGTDRTSCFTNVSKVNGTLEVTALPVTFDLGLDYETFTYNGLPIYLDSITGTYPNGSDLGQSVFDYSYEEVIVFDVFDEYDYVFSYTWTFNLLGGETVTLTLYRPTELGTYELKPDVSVTGNANHYSFIFTNSLMTLESGGYITWALDHTTLTHRTENGNYIYKILNYDASWAYYISRIEDHIPINTVVNNMKALGYIATTW